MRSILLGLVLAIAASAQAQPVPAGPEFLVNSYTTAAYQSEYNRRRPAVAADATGNFVVVWSSWQDGYGDGVFGQRYDSAGVAQGSEFQVNSYTTYNQRHPAVAADAAGNVLVVWESERNPGGAIIGQRYDSAGVPQGGEFDVAANMAAGSGPSYPVVAAGGDGNFVVVWKDDASDSIDGRRYDSAGVPQGGMFQVASAGSGDRVDYPAVAADAAGNFLVAWQLRSGSRLPADEDIVGRVYNSAGIPQGSEFVVNSYTTDDQSYPAVAADAAGNFMIVWAGDEYSEHRISGQRYDSTGVPQGANFVVSATFAEYSPDFETATHPAVAGAPEGGFVVAWESSGTYLPGPEEDRNGIFGRRYDSRGNRICGRFHVNTYTTGVQQYPAVATDGTGNFLVVWMGDVGFVGPTNNVGGQRYVLNSDPGADYDCDGVPTNADNCPTVSNPAQSDADSDTVGDGCDLCAHAAGTGVGAFDAVRKVLLIYKRNGPGGGDDAPKVLNAEFTSTAVFDPALNDDVYVALTAMPSGDVLFAATLEASSGKWTRPNPAKKIWKYLDPVSPTTAGVRKALLKEVPAGSGHYRFKLVGKDADIARSLAPGEAINLRFETGTTIGEAGVCSEGSLPACSSTSAIDRCSS